MCYHSFNLTMGRSPRFASASTDFRPIQTCFRYGFVPEVLNLAREEQLVGSLCKRHAVARRLRPLVNVRFQVLFTSLFEILFTFPSRYLFAIGLSGVFSLTRWCWQIQTEFHRLRPTQVPSYDDLISYTGLSPSMVGFPKPFYYLHIIYFDGPTTPKRHCYTLRFGLIPFRSPLLWKSLLFSLPPLT